MARWTDDPIDRFSSQRSSLILNPPVPLAHLTKRSWAFLNCMRADSAVLTPESKGISECLDRLASQKRGNRPLSTYRLQFHAGFRFEDAQRLIGYLHALGISHVYSSPVLHARSGSSHGYDITDHNRLNPEIGSYEDLQALVRELKSYGMGLVLDFVPNHMGIGYGANPWLDDVLRNGRTSEFAEF